MKKIIVLILGILTLTSGCKEDTHEDLIEKFSDSVTKVESYKLTGKMEIINGDDTFTYTLESNYLQDNFYKVVLINETNNHEQIILRNEEGIYVITPSLNKSFKFDSIWPDNSSQGYLLKSLVDDINEDEESELIEDENNFIVTTKVDYPNNKSLIYQKIYFDKEMIPTKVEVYDENDSIAITVTILKVDLNAKLKETDFLLEDYITDSDCAETCTEEPDCEESCETQTTSSSLDSIIYPLYTPSNTSLTSSEKISNEYTERVILTFGGDKNYVLIEEASRVNNEFEIIPINGSPLLINDTVGALSTNSMYFTRNDIDYYLVSNDLTNEEMISIASSIGNVQSVMSEK